MPENAFMRGVQNKVFRHTIKNNAMMRFESIIAGFAAGKDGRRDGKSKPKSK